MKNRESWFPTKYEFSKGKLRASRNKKFVTVSSRLMADITASFYDHYVPIHVRGRLADLGCGHVPFYQLYKKYTTENICVDWPGTRHKNEYLDFECNMNEPLPLGTAEFDTIIISEVLEHIAHPEILWPEMARILKQNGKILLSVPFLYKIHEAPYDYYRYTEFCLRNLASKNGFKTIELKAFGGLPEVFTDILAKKFLGIPVLGSISSRFIQAACRVFLRSKVGQKISQQTGKEFPLGYFMIVEKI
jgi:SAM-dependent methyltransferase